MRVSSFILLVELIVAHFSYSSREISLSAAFNSHEVTSRSPSSLSGRGASYHIDPQGFAIFQPLELFEYIYKTFLGIDFFQVCKADDFIFFNIVNMLKIKAATALCPAVSYIGSLG